MEWKGTNPPKGPGVRDVEQKEESFWSGNQETLGSKPKTTITRLSAFSGFAHPTIHFSAADSLRGAVLFVGMVIILLNQAFKQVFQTLNSGFQG